MDEQTKALLVREARERIALRDEHQIGGVRRQLATALEKVARHDAWIARLRQDVADAEQANAGDKALVALLESTTQPAPAEPDRNDPKSAYWR